MFYWVEVNNEGRILRALNGPINAQPVAMWNGAIVPVPRQANPTTEAYLDGALYLIGDKPSPVHMYDYVEREWIDPRSFEQLKYEKWNSIKTARDSAEFGGFEWDGSVFDSDQVSQSRIQGAIQLASMAGELFEIEWTLMDNSTRMLSYLDLMSVGIALGQHVGLQHGKGRFLRDQIESAIDIEELNSIAWTD